MAKIKFIKILFRAVFGILLISFLIYKYLKGYHPFSYSEINNYYLIFGILLILFSFSFAIIRLYVVVSDYVSGILEVIKIFFIGWFFSNLLPTTFGGDVYQVSYINKRVKSLSSSVALISIQRIIPVFVLLIYGFFYTILRPELWNKISLSKIKIGFFDILMISILLLVVLLTILYIFRKQLLKYFNKIKSFLINFYKSLKDLSITKYFHLLFLSVIFQFTRMTGLYILLLGMDCKVNMLDFFFIIAFVAILSMIPLSIGALGIQESGIVFGLHLLGVKINVGIAVAFLYRGVFILFTIVGGIIYLSSKRKNQS